MNEKKETIALMLKVISQKFKNGATLYQNTCLNKSTNNIIKKNTILKQF